MLYGEDERLKLRETKKFSDTNKIWNDLELNTKKNIGCLMFLIKECNPKFKEEWEKYYFKSGNERSKISVNSYGLDINKYNAEYGRTERELLTIAHKLKPYCDNSLKLAYNFVYIRVIDETWIGYEREVTALKKIEKYLNKFYNNFTVKNTSYQVDIYYAVDFEIYDVDKLVLGVQLKSDNYLNAKSSYMNELKKINIEKNDLYTKKNNAEVFYLYTQSNCYLMNFDELKQKIRKLAPAS